MTVEVRLFGPLAARAGAAQVSVHCADPTTAAVLAALDQQHPALKEVLPSCRLAVNHAYAAADQRLSATDEIALIGLVNGG
jgi:molybdopterin converting factor small subunit